MKKHNIIYADPAWLYQDKCNAGKRGAEFKYPVMPVSEMAKLPMSEWSAPDSVLFMWATWPLLTDALALIEAWGFNYKTIGFLWVKTNAKAGTPFIGMGNWTRSNSEPCLLATRGKPKRFDSKAARSISSVIISPKREHSRKPDEVRDHIVTLCGDVPRLEMFARTTAPGWDVWGNEVNKF